MTEDRVPALSLHTLPDNTMPFSRVLAKAENRAFPHDKVDIGIVAAPFLSPPLGTPRREQCWLSKSGSRLEFAGGLQTVAA